MVDNLIEILSQFDYPVRRQGSFGKNEPYPDSFFTFWNDESPDHKYYDNVNYGVVWYFNVYFYSINPSNTYDVLEQARQALKAAGWITPGRGYDVLSDEPTHTGRGMQVIFLEF